MEMKDSVSLQKRGAVMEEKTRKPETAKQTAIILVIVILKATGVPFAVKDWLSHVTGDMIALR